MYMYMYIRQNPAIDPNPVQGPVTCAPDVTLTCQCYDGVGDMSPVHMSLSPPFYDHQAHLAPVYKIAYIILCKNCLLRSCTCNLQPLPSPPFPCGRTHALRCSAPFSVSCAFNYLQNKPIPALLALLAPPRHRPQNDLVSSPSVRGYRQCVLSGV